MTGFARLRTLAAMVAVLAGAAPGPGLAQSAAVVVRPADALFADASAKELAVRKSLAAPAPQPTLLKAVRTVVADYEQVVRQHPTSGFCDDALWRAATLARDAFAIFGEARERTVALRLFQLLTSEYPTSTFATQTPKPMAWLNAHPATRNSSVPQPPLPHWRRIRPRPRQWRQRQSPPPCVRSGPPSRQPQRRRSRRRSW